MKQYFLLIGLIIVAPIIGVAQNPVSISAYHANHYRSYYWTFLPGDMITVSISYFNRSDTLQRLHFPSTCQYNFCVDSSWCWGNGRACGDMLTEVDIPPHDTHVWTDSVVANFPVGVHTLVGWVGDLDSTRLMYGSANLTFFIPSVTTFTYHLIGAWNMVSYPLFTPGVSKESIFLHSISQAFGFDGRYVPTDMLQNGYGYWIKLDHGDSLTYSGLPLLIDTINVKKGWNMIGSIGVTFPISSIKTIPSSMVVTPWQPLIGYTGYRQDTNLHPGQAIWLKASDNGKIVLADDSNLTQTITVIKGWNHFLSPGFPVLVGSITSNPADIIISRFVAYNGGYYYASILKPYTEYMVKTAMAGKIILDGSASKQQK